MNDYTKIVGVIFVLSIMVSCGGSNLGLSPPPKDPVGAQQLIDQAWVEYENARYQNAINLFNEAREKDSALLDIYNGLGWSYFKTHKLILSLSNFSIAIGADSSFADAMVGYSISAFEKNEYDQTIRVFNTIARIDSAEFNIRGTDEYVFSHDSSVTSRKVRNILALCYYYSGRFMESFYQLKNFLDPFTKVDTSSETFLTDLFTALEKI